MKLSFPDKSHIEFVVLPSSKIQITLLAKDALNINNTIMNSVEITKEDFNNLVKDVNNKLPENKEVESVTEDKQISVEVTKDQNSNTQESP